MDSKRPQKLVFGLLAGEASGDILGADLIRQLKTLHPSAEFVGIGGSLMQKEGLKTLHDMERLSVMGFVEPLKRLPELLKIRSSIVSYFKDNPPAVFIGIDAPDFNLGIEKRLKRSGIKTVHYVSPSVWAWRQWRIKKIKSAVDHMLCVFPFEAKFYEQHQVPVTFVGHSMADQIELDSDKEAARRSLGVAEDGLTLAVLPGSRSAEIKFLGPVFMDTVKRLQLDTGVGEILVAAASETGYKRLTAMAAKSDARVRIFLGHAREVLTAADAALVGSGTVTLEAMLTKTPMTVAYRMEKISFWIAEKLVNLKYISLPNILADERLVNEYVQDEVAVDNLYLDLKELLDSSQRRQEICGSFTRLHQSIRKNASARAAQSVSALLENSDD